VEKSLRKMTKYIDILKMEKKEAIIIVLNPVMRVCGFNE